MKVMMKTKHVIYLLALLFTAGLFVACEKDEDEDPDPVEPASLQVNLTFTGQILPEAGQTVVVKLFFESVSGINIMEATADQQIQELLTPGDIGTGLSVTFEDIPHDADVINLGAYVDTNENGELDAGDLAVFYDNVSAEKVMEGEATPDNLAGSTTVSLDLNIIYGEDELAIDIDGNVYKVVVIGEQEWTAENLRVTRFRNGDEIPTGHDSEAWENLMNPEDGTGTPAYAQNPEGLSEDGMLYNWFAVADTRGLCPEGWREPSDEDWLELELFLGMDAEEALLYTWRGAEEEVGTKLKSARRDMGGTDDYGFDAIPSGMRSGIGTYARYGLDFFYWSNSEDPRGGDTYYLNGIRRALRNSRSDIVRQANTKAGGYAVRCLRDVK